MACSLIDDYMLKIFLIATAARSSNLTMTKVIEVTLLWARFRLGALRNFVKFESQFFLCFKFFFSFTIMSAWNMSFPHEQLCH
jgi:hypothetical protein